MHDFNTWHPSWQPHTTNDEPECPDPIDHRCLRGMSLREIADMPIEPARNADSSRPTPVQPVAQGFRVRFWR